MVGPPTDPMQRIVNNAMGDTKEIGEAASGTRKIVLYKNGNNRRLFPMYVMRCEQKKAFFKSKFSTGSFVNKLSFV